MTLYKQSTSYHGLRGYHRPVSLQSVGIMAWPEIQQAPIRPYLSSLKADPALLFVLSASCEPLGSCFSLHSSQAAD